ncbi:hypothetical protein SAMN06295885_1557 [Rathayibacter oskolensis]|uniref:Uncharacterized protein n=1 Tax=Rathayibacter oskolensis TaxID=1891671 RepID=A0A1X7NMV3_9MICO|nr:hypothetical protein [Rathayibacter oskolensis]SMH38867.1 hypothetical protein SAMN06295885_1557 [Rathayibacter oskolensis]
MQNDDRLPRLPRLLIALTRLRLARDEAPVFTHLAEALARELPGRALPMALLRLRHHLHTSSRG